MASRETGVVRQRLGGDTAAAQRLNGIARTQLGILKELMAFGNLRQLSRTVRLGDGTEIFVQSMFGQDTVRITPPVAAVEVVGGAEEATTQGRYVYVAGTDGVRTYRWKIGVDGRRLISTTDVGPASGSTILMTNDGTVIVFGSYNSITGMYRVYRWTPSAGAVDIGVDYNDLAVGYGYPSIAMSTDGSVISVYGHNVTSGQDRVYRWTAAGLVDIGIYAAVNTMVLSRDGTTIVALGYSGPLGAAFVWSASDGLVQIPTLVPEVGYSFGAIAVSADGTQVAVGAYPDSTSGLDFTIFRWSRSTGAIPSGISANYATAGAISMSSDGSTIVFVGMFDAQNYCKLYYWGTSVGVVDTRLQTNFQYTAYYNPFLLSSDGSIALIMDSSLLNWRNIQPCRWTAAAGALRPNVTFNLSAFSHIAAFITPDGGISSFSGPVSALPTAYRWDSSGSPVNLGAVGTYGSMVGAMTSDGLILVGNSSSYYTLWTPDERFTFWPSGGLYSVNPMQISGVLVE